MRHLQSGRRGDVSSLPGRGGLPGASWGLTGPIVPGGSLPPGGIKVLDSHLAFSGLICKEILSFFLTDSWRWESRLPFNLCWHVFYDRWCYSAVRPQKPMVALPLVDSSIFSSYDGIGDQSWVFIGKTDVEVETPILWPPDAKSCLIWKDPDAGKDWGQEEKGTTEDEMVGWHHRLNGHEFG